MKPTHVREMPELSAAHVLAYQMFVAIHDAYGRGSYQQADAWIRLSTDEKRVYIEEALSWIRAHRPHAVRSIVTGLHTKVIGGINLPEAS
jgi:hypothetical protein